MSAYSSPHQIYPSWWPVSARYVTTLSLVSVLLAGCAGDLAFREGVALEAGGNPSGAIQHYQEAIKLNPDRPEYRLALLRAQDARIKQTLLEVDADRAMGRTEAALEKLNQLLASKSGAELALKLIREIQKERRHQGMMAQAHRLIQNQDNSAAILELERILAEKPTHEDALALLGRIRPQDDAVYTDPKIGEAFKQPISLDFRDAPIKAVTEVISRTSGFNIVLDKDLRPDIKVSIFTKNTSIEKTLDMIAVSNQLAVRLVNANTLLIYPNTPAKLRDYQTTLVKAFYLSDADPKSVSASLKTLLKIRDVVVDEKLNMLIVRDSPQQVSLASKLIAMHDRPDAEVMLEVEVLEVKHNKLMTLGIQWPDQVPITAMPFGADPVSIQTVIRPDQWGITLGKWMANAKATDSDTSILANPRIRVKNKGTAKVAIGDRVPNISTSINATNNVSTEVIKYEDVGLDLKLDPTIHIDGEITIGITLEVTNLVSQLKTNAGSLAYQLGRRKVESVLRLRDGETQVLAGLINDEDRRSGNRVPGIGKLPILGRLFGVQTDDINKTEILLVITPRILRNITRPSIGHGQFEAGPEGGNTSIVSNSPNNGIAISAPSTELPRDFLPQKPVKVSDDSKSSDNVPAISK